MPRYLTVYCLTIAACFALPARADVTYENVQDGDNEIESCPHDRHPRGGTGAGAAASPCGARHRPEGRQRGAVLLSGTAGFNQTMDRVRKEFGDEYDTWYFGGGDVIPIAKLTTRQSPQSNRNVKWPNPRLSARRRCCAATATGPWTWKVCVVPM